jgi:hypothetical protein
MFFGLVLDLSMACRKPECVFLFGSCNFIVGTKFSFENSWSVIPKYSKIDFHLDCLQ